MRSPPIEKPAASKVRPPVLPGGFGNRLALGSCAPCDKAALRLQPKLEIGAVDDPLEREADRAADAVLSGSIRDFSQIPFTVQRQATAAPAGGPAPPSVHRALAQPGRPLDLAVRRDLEPRFGRDFSAVRIHDGAAAARSAREIGASAYTVSSNIVFGPGRYAPGSGEGRRLLAHELAHTVQQASHPGSVIQRKIQDGQDQGEGDPLANREYDPNTGRDYPSGYLARAAFLKGRAEYRMKLPRPEAVAVATKSLNQWGRSHFEAASRMRTWLVQNLIKFQGESLEAKKEASSGLGQQIKKAVASQLVSWGVGQVATKVAMSVLSVAFLATRAAKFLGGVFSAFVSLVLDKILGMVFDSDLDPVKVSQENLVFTNAINEAVDNHERDKLNFIDITSDKLHSNEKTPQEISEAGISLEDSSESHRFICPNINDMSLYEKLMLQNEVYDSDKTLVADNKSTQAVKGTTGAIKFAISREKTADEPIRFVHSDNSTVSVEITSYHCKLGDGELPASANGVQDGSPVHPATSSYYTPSMFKVTLIAGTDTKDPKYPDRWFSVGKKQYGTWYKVGRGFYQIRVTRELGHLKGNRNEIALCGYGTFKAGIAQ